MRLGCLMVHLGQAFVRCQEAYSLWKQTFNSATRNQCGMRVPSVARHIMDGSCVIAFPATHKSNPKTHWKIMVTLHAWYRPPPTQGPELIDVNSLA